MANGLTFEILTLILRVFYPCKFFNRKWPLQNFKEIGPKLTEKLPKIMRSMAWPWLILFNLTASRLDLDYRIIPNKRTAPNKHAPPPFFMYFVYPVSWLEKIYQTPAFCV